MKKRILIIVFVCLTIFILLLLVIYYYFYAVKEVDYLESNIENKFNIYKINYFSDVSTLSNTTTFQNPEWNVNVYEYTDIAIYLERITDYNVESYIKNIYINNILVENPQLGNPKLYYLNPLNFGDSDYTSEISDYEITNELEYSVMNYENSDDDVKYTIPIFFEDCSNPITLRFINYDILENYIIEENTKTEFNGSILKSENILLSDIETSISFELNIITGDDEIHTINIEIEIPLENGDENIFEGYIFITKNNLSNKF